MCVARNLALQPAIVAGGGSAEMAVAKGLNARAKNIEGVEQWPYKAAAMALEVLGSSFTKLFLQCPSCLLSC